MKSKKFTKSMLVIAVPIMIQSLITASVNLIDTVMIGKLGEKSIASLGITNQYFMLYSILVIGLYTGVGVLISQYWGKNNQEKIKDFTSLQIKLGFALSVFFALIGYFYPRQIVGLFSSDGEVIRLGASYLRIVIVGYIPFAIAGGYGVASRSIGNTVIPMMASLVAVFVNVILNYGLIYGNLGMPMMGVRGAALATSIARIIEMLVVIIAVYSSKNVLAIKLPKLLVFDKQAFKQASGPMSQVVLNDLCWVLGMMIYTMLYGRIGTGAIASIQIMTTVQQMFMIAIIAVSSAACVMIGKLVGENDYDTAKELSWYFLRVVLFITVAIAVAVYAGVNVILMVFTLSPEVYSAARALLILSAFIMPVRGLSILYIIGILRGGGDAKGALKIELFTMWLIGVPLCYIGSIILQWPVEYVYIMVATEEFAKLILSFVRFKKGDWIRNFTEVDEAVDLSL